MFNNEDVFVTVNGKSYKAICGCYEHSPYEAPTLEIETILHPNYEVPRLKIVDVIFNDPATIVFWSDGTKTVVKTQDGECYDPEKGMAMAFCKKLMGDNKRDYYHTFLHYLKKYNEQQAKTESKPNVDNSSYTSSLSEAAERFAERIRAFHENQLTNTR